MKNSALRVLNGNWHKNGIGHFHVNKNDLLFELYQVWREPITDQQFFNFFLMISLKLDPAILYGAAAGEFCLQLLGQLLQVDILGVDAIDNGRDLLKTSRVRINTYLLTLLRQVFADA